MSKFHFIAVMVDILKGLYMFKKKKKQMSQNSVRVIKISKDALFEFIYENMIDDQEIFLDVDSLSVSSSFDIDWENGQFIFCAHKSEDENGAFIEFPKGIDLQKLMRRLPDTTSTMYEDCRYREYTKDELIELSKD